jgi:hypothetical protein
MPSNQKTKELELSDQLEKDLQMSSEGELKESLISRELFGGAIRVDIPSQWRDVSLVRQVPDHQECYQDCTFEDGSKRSLQGTGGCLIVEILAREDVTDEDAPKYFFRDLAEANGGIVGDLDFQVVDTVGKGISDDLQSQSDNVTMPNLSKQVKVCSCAGVQSIAPLKNNMELEEGKADRVRIELCAVRLMDEETDILLTLTIPLEKKGINDDESRGKLGELFLSILRGFEVCDWTLFG